MQGTAARVDWDRIDTVLVDMDGTLLDLAFDNFFWLELGDRDEDEVIRELGRRGVAVRAGKGLGSEGYARVTYGTRPENERLIEALRQILQPE